MDREKIYQEKELLLRIAAGDEQAFSVLFHQYRKKILYVSKLYLKTEALAEEAMQDVFMKVWVNRTKLSGVKDLESWLFILAKNYLVDAVEKWARKKTAEDRWGTDHAAISQEGETDTAVQGYYKILESAINQLPSQQQAVFRLAKEEGLSYKEIADKLSLSPLTVKTHLQRAMQQIRGYLCAHPEVLLLFYGYLQLFLSSSSLLA